MDRLAGSLEQLIHEMWPGGAAAEAKPYAFIVPCPTEGCPGYYLRDDLFQDLAEGDGNRAATRAAAAATISESC